LEDTEPATHRAKEEFFDTIRHASAVVGLNSTSLIESAIIGRPVLTWLAPAYSASQTGTVHFGLIAGADGLLIVGRTWEEHMEHLCAALRDQDLDGERSGCAPRSEPVSVEACADPCRLLADGAI